MITPQAIKDQEFQIKFRGYDAIEVRAYLDLLADDFFELTEQNRIQSEEIETLLAEQESQHREKEALAAEVKETQESVESIQAEIEEGYQHKDTEIAELRAEVTALQETVARLEQEKSEAQETITALEARLTEGSGASGLDQAEIETLRARMAFLEEQNKEMKQEGVDFKTTILAAQKFADNLRQTSEEDARKLMEEAQAEVEKFRRDAEHELAHLPKEIDELQQQKKRAREEVRTLLLSYLNALDISPEDTTKENDEDLSDLFESIQIPDDEMVDPDDLHNIGMDLSKELGDLQR